MIYKFHSKCFGLCYEYIINESTDRNFKNKCGAHPSTNSIIRDSPQTVLVAHLALVRLLPRDL